MNNKTFADIGFGIIGLVLIPFAFKKIFVNKSSEDYRSKWSLT